MSATFSWQYDGKSKRTAAQGFKAQYVRHFESMMFALPINLYLAGVLTLGRNRKGGSDHISTIFKLTEFMKEDI